MKDIMKKIIVSLVAILCTVGLWAVPAYPGWQTKTASDGTTIEVRLVGDEYCSYWATEDGKLAIEQADGTFVKSDKALPTKEEFRARRTRAREMRNAAPDFAPKGMKRVKKAVGTTPNLAPKGVVILVNFSDSEMNSNHTQSVFDDMCNSENCQNNTYNNKKYGSAAQYFADQSNGAYRPVFDVFGPVNVPNNVEYYGEDGPEQSDGSREHDLYMGDFVVDAVLAAEAQGCDFSQYDSDNDGYVDFVYFIFAGKGQANGGSVSTIWPHNSSLIGQLYYGRTHGRTDYYINSESDYNLLIMDGKAIDNYACSAELDGSGNLDGIGTLCHEFGHVMGLPDFYDTSYGYNYENHLTPNEWNIMDGGSYNGGSHCPPNYDPWEKYFFGWIDPINPGNEGANVTLYPNGSEDYNVYQINASGTQQGPTSSGLCYYLENRQKSGWDSFLPASGMVIWRLDFNASAWSSNKPNHSSTSGSPLYTLVCSSGTMIGEQWVYNETKAKWEKVNDGTNNVFPGKENVTSWSGVSGKPVTGITQVGNNITFQYKDGAISSSCAVPTDIQAETTDATATLAWDGEADGYEIRYLEGEYTEEEGELFSGTTNFDGDLAGWTTIDADGDGHTWNAKSWYVYSESYINNVGALTPDNYLVSPKIRLGGSISFYASGASTWCAEHFGVAVSTKSNTDAADFTMVSQEWIADSVWTKYTVDLSAYSGTGYVAIRHFNITDMYILAVAEIEITAPEETIIPWSVVEGISEKQHTIQNLKDSTLYTAQVRSRCGEVFSEWSTSVVFTTKAKVALPPCDEPTDVQVVAVTDSTATISWTGEADGYEIRFVEGELAEEGELFSGITSFEGTLAGWTTIDADGDGHIWAAESGYAYSESYINNVGALTPDNYLVSPKIRLGGSISFYASGASTWCAEHFGVAVSTKSNTDAADFTMVSQEWIADSVWTKYTVDLSAYSGTGYVAIRHFNITDMYILAVAEIEITAPEETIIPWSVVEGISEKQHTIQNLKDSTLYTAQVRSRCGEAYSEWTESVVFTTLAKPEPIVPEKPKWTEWAYYDDGTFEDAIGTGGSTFFWGVMFPANTLGGDTLSKIAVYEKAEANTQAIIIDIYSDGDAPIAANKIYTETVAPAGKDGFHEITLHTPVVIDTLKNVWVILSEGTDKYPASACVNTGDPNGRWVSMDGINWMDLIEANSDLKYTFMIRAYVGPVEHKQVEGVENVQEDNAHGTKVLRDGQLLILRDGKTYTILGTKIEK